VAAALDPPPSAWFASTVGSALAGPRLSTDWCPSWRAPRAIPPQVRSPNDPRHRQQTRMSAPPDVTIAILLAGLRL